MFGYRIRHRKRGRRRRVTKHYLAHKEKARDFVHKRISVLNLEYGFKINRIAIRNQKTCWGSCSELGNLNFNYAVLFLPKELADYIIVHELCHLKELNHSPRFWELVSRTVPDYKLHKKNLKKIPTATSTLYKVSRVVNTATV